MTEHDYADAELLGGPLDGDRYTLQVLAPDGGPPFLVSFYGFQGSPVSGDPDEEFLEDVEIRYQRQQLPRTDGSWRYLYIDTGPAPEAQEPQR